MARRVREHTPVAPDVERAQPDPSGPLSLFGTQKLRLRLTDGTRRNQRVRQLADLSQRQLCVQPFDAPVDIAGAVPKWHRIPDPAAADAGVRTDLHAMRLMLRQDRPQLVQLARRQR